MGERGSKDPSTIDKDGKRREKIKNASFDTTSFMDDPYYVLWLGLAWLAASSQRLRKEFE